MNTDSASGVKLKDEKQSRFSDEETVDETPSDLAIRTEFYRLIGRLLAKRWIEEQQGTDGIKPK